MFAIVLVCARCGSLACHRAFVGLSAFLSLVALAGDLYILVGMGDGLTPSVHLYGSVFSTVTAGITGALFCSLMGMYKALPFLDLRSR